MTPESACFPQAHQGAAKKCSLQHSRATTGPFPRPKRDHTTARQALPLTFSQVSESEPSSRHIHPSAPKHAHNANCTFWLPSMLKSVDPSSKRGMAGGREHQPALPHFFSSARQPVLQVSARRTRDEAPRQPTNAVARGPQQHFRRWQKGGCGASTPQRGTATRAAADTCKTGCQGGPKRENGPISCSRTPTAPDGSVRQRACHWSCYYKVICNHT